MIETEPVPGLELQQQMQGSKTGQGSRGASQPCGTGFLQQTCKGGVQRAQASVSTPQHHITVHVTCMSGFGFLQPQHALTWHQAASATVWATAEAAAGADYFAVMSRLTGKDSKP